jgi:hypothetical protein
VPVAALASLLSASGFASALMMASMTSLSLSPSY